MTTPTMNKMLKVYLESAQVESLKCGRPNEGTVKNTLVGYRRFMRWVNDRRERCGHDRMALDEDFPLVSVIKPPLIHKYLADMLKDGTRPITAISSLYQLRQLFAKWVLPYYEDRGWKIPPFPSFGHRPKAPRYRRPDEAALSKVKEWYVALRPGELWFVATMMLEFAMRNGDIMRLRRDNFVERDEAVFDELNAAMRGMGFTGTKGAYELRKICVDHVYQKFGAEMAVSISGDDIRTIMHYYADPAQPNIDNIRVTDLI